MMKPDSTNTSEHPQSLLEQAEALARRRYWQESDSIFLRAVEEDSSPVSRIVYGCALAEQERYHEAICQTTSALDLAMARADRSALSAIYHNLAVIYRELGDLTLARQFQQRAISQQDDCGAVEMLGLANDAWLSDREELAACLADAAITLHEDDDSDLSADVEATLGLFDGLSNDPRGVVRILLKSYTQHQASGNIRRMGMDLLNLSLAYGQLGRYRRELACVRRAITMFEMAPAQFSAAKARRILSDLERRQALREFDPRRN